MLPPKTPEVLLVDHDDSFTYNLVHLIAAAGGRAVVRRLNEVEADSSSDAILLGPGHGRPSATAKLVGELSAANPLRPILGVCLGHQAIAEWSGSVVRRSSRPTHGDRVHVVHDGRGVFRGLPSPVAAARYNSLTVSEEALAETLEVIARSAEGEVMALRHRALPIQGIQFHPESVLSDFGCQMLRNWLEDM